LFFFVLGTRVKQHGERIEWKFEGRRFNLIGSSAKQWSLLPDWSVFFAASVLSSLIGYIRLPLTSFRMGTNRKHKHFSKGSNEWNLIGSFSSQFRRLFLGSHFLSSRSIALQLRRVCLLNTNQSYRVHYRFVVESVISERDPAIYANEVDLIH